MTVDGFERSGAKPIEVMAVVMGLTNSSGGFFGAAEDRLSGHVDE